MNTSALLRLAVILAVAASLNGFASWAAPVEVAPAASRGRTPVTLVLPEGYHWVRDEAAKPEAPAEGTSLRAASDEGVELEMALVASSRFTPDDLPKSVAAGQRTYDKPPAAKVRLAEYFDGPGPRRWALLVVDLKMKDGDYVLFSLSASVQGHLFFLRGLARSKLEARLKSGIGDFIEKNPLAGK